MTSCFRAGPVAACFALVLGMGLMAPVAFAVDGGQDVSAHDYPTQGRVEYVLGCMDDNGHDFANVYKCSCAIDHIAAALPYDDYVEQMTFSKYSTLGGEGGSEFRVDRAKAKSRNFLSVQGAAYRACGLTRTAGAK